MRPEPDQSRPSRRIITVLLALFAIVLVAQLIVGIPQFIFYGLIGGLVFCLIIIGRDRLLDAQRGLEPPLAQASPTDNDKQG